MIYLRLINHWTTLLDQFVDKGEAISNFILEFKKPMFGLSHRTQSLRHHIQPDNYEMTIEEAVSAFDLDQVFSGVFSCSPKTKPSFSSQLRNMQYVAKNIIHLYTGMRDQEVNRLLYNCLSDEKISGDIKSNEGVTLDDARVVTIISTTTKFTGYRKEESWIAFGDVARAVRFLQMMSKSLAILGNHELQSSPLFFNPSIISKPCDGAYTTVFYKTRTFPVNANVIIQPSDLDELKLSDPGRNFDAEDRFAVGELWPLTTHQYRRSLAFYASNSGFVSLPSLKNQFKHVTRQMTQYYCNGFENMRSIFGSYNKTTGEYGLPSSHIAYEFQLSTSIDMAHQIIADVLGSEEQLFGATGSYIEKQKLKGNSKVNIEEFRKDTEKRVIKGELAYRETLLGGCTKIGECDEHMLGDYTSCLNCPGSIIKPDKLNSMLEQSENELANYEVGTGEHFIVQAEVDKLRNFQERKIKKMGAK